MKKQILCEYVLDGHKCQSWIVDYEYLSKLKKHRKNRPSGDIDDEIGDYLDSEKKSGKFETKKLIKRFSAIGFDPKVKIFRVGIVNGDEYKMDGQHCVAAVRFINEEYIKEHGSPLYDEFRVESIDFENDEKEFIKHLEKFNNLTTKYKPKDFANTSVDDEVGIEMRRLCREMGISPNLALIWMFGNLSTDGYENPTQDKTKKNYKRAAEVFTYILNDLKSHGGHPIVEKMIKTNQFTVLCELFSNIYHKKYLTLRKEGFDENDAFEKVDEFGKELAKHFLNIDRPFFLQELSKKVSHEDGRKAYYKSVFKKLLLSTENEAFKTKEYINSIKSLNGTELKKIIQDWAEEGKKNSIKG